MKRVHYVKANRANLCLDCDTIYSSPSCPVCGSSASWPISKWINRSAAPVFPFNDPDNFQPRKHALPERYAS